MPTLQEAKTVATPKEVKQAADKLRKQLAQLDQLTGKSRQRTSDADRMAAKRAAERDLTPPRIKDLSRRLQLEKDDAAWLNFYLPHIYINPLCEGRLENIQQVRYCVEYGVRKCIAAPRRSGKTTDFRYVLMKDALAGELPFAYLVSASGGKANESEQALRDTIEAAQPGDPLFDDYPFQCSVIQEIARAPSRQHNATVHGMKLHCRWSHNRPIVFPSVRDPDPNHELLWDYYRIEANKLGAILCSCGVTSSMLQGANVLNVRPSIIGLDDVDDRESTDIETGVMADKIESIIDNTIAGMGGQGKPMGQVMLCTVPSRNSVAFKYSDPQQKPAWDGLRIPRLKSWPAEEMWLEYIRLKHEGLQKLDADKKPIDKFGRNAHAYYLANREAMDAGAEVYDDSDFKSIKMPDGSQQQVSAIQDCFDYIAEVGLDSFNTEHQQQPPKDAGQFKPSITDYVIMTAEPDDAWPRLQVAADTELIVRGVDVRQIELHHAAISASNDNPHRLPDYGVRSHGTTETTKEMAEELIEQALLEIADEWHDDPFLDPSGAPVSMDLTLVDAGWMASWDEDGEGKTWSEQPVQNACGILGYRRWIPAKGQPNYKKPKPAATPGKLSVFPGPHWHLLIDSRPRSVLCVWDVEHWRGLIEDLFLTEDAREAFVLFESERGVYSNHRRFAEHIRNGADELAESRRRSTRTRKRRSRRDHWWDSLAMALVAKSVEQTIREDPRLAARLSGERRRRNLRDLQRITG